MASGSELDYATLAAHGQEPEMEQNDDYDDDYDDDDYEPEQYEEEDDEDDGGFEREYTVDEDRLLRTTNAMTRSFRSFAVDSTPAAAASTTTTTTTLVAVDAKDGEDTCFVCLDKVPDCKFVDCNHLNNTGYICCICADRLIKGSRKCPLCRGVVTRYEVVDAVPDSWDN